MKINYLLQFAALWLGLNTAQAQRQAGDYGLRGTISDSLTNNPIDFITVNLMKSQTEVHKVDYTKNDGSFSFTGVEKGKYHLAIIGVGYKTLMVEVDLTDSTQKTLELGKLILRPDVIGLKEVVVTTLKPIVTQEVDRIVYDMQADPESKVLTVLDMMRKVPMLSLDAENNILMKGNSDFKILINGRPSSMMERSYKDILRSMPASSIERIEVITSPPAKYDAEGLAGIINIITNKKLDNGYNGTLNVSERFPAGGPGIGGSLNAKIGKFGISSFGGANIYNNPVTTNTTNRATSGAYPTFLKQEGTNRSDSKNGYLGIELSYEIDSLNLISGQFNVNGNNYTDVPYQWSALMRSGELVQGFKINGRNTGQGNGLDMALNYQKGFRSNKNRLLTFSYRSVSYNNNQFVNTTITEKIDSDLLDYRQSNDQYFGEQTVQVDYVHPWKKLTLETGLKGIMRNNNSDFQYLQLDPETGDYVLQDGRSNRFRNRQDVYGAYTSFQYNLKNWSLKAGARIEETVIHADFITTESALNRTYFNVIPSVALSRKLKDNRGLNITFNQRIQP